MGLSTSQGVVSTTSSPTDNKYIEDNISTQPSPEQQQIDKPYVKDTFVNKTSLNLDRHAGVLKALEGYVSGTPIKVTYYHNQVSNTDDVANDTDIAITLNPVHSNLLQINNFEFKLSEPLQFDYDNDRVLSTVRGTGITYPGFNPVIGDFFIYEIEQGKLALFEIDTAPQRLSIKSNTCYNISFILKEFVDNQYIEQIKLRVKDIVYFDKQTFLQGNAALLYEDDYLALVECEKKIYQLIDFYNDKFYNSLVYNSFMRTDEVYDPYIIDFIQKVVDYSMFKQYPSQLIVEPVFKDFTIWEKIIKPNMVPWEVIIDKCSIETKKYTVKDVKLTPLINKLFIELKKDYDPADPNIIDYAFGDVSGMFIDQYDNFKKMLTVYLNSNIINLRDLLTLISNYLYLNDVEQFYRLPLYIYLLKRCEEGLRNHTLKFKTDITDDLPKIHPFSDTDLTNNTIEIPLQDDSTRVIGIRDENDTPWYAKMGFTTYKTDSVVIDIQPILDEREIQSMTGTWKIIFSK